ncbi:ABC transporter substrate binding protein [Azorhizobium caulinodans ORS 571]|uniref:Putative aliphatic sulfonates-binding protein n=1 Tax=Azorhizobium caulinodans (strain ATCC 43989 / DSM 5975 / JCM 20966 / LMG 6465 / NBRC 14845 / NCIMB 13405 / ORS 571) TaxID=438753 RepID=A8IC47_AZOC5|nr:sulfonate ABC transporter substrate-binding protein [Azorhizobium caulinodans]BAF89158.1 ABC transporter substrate binding protein [Azorhizobium caulinodans ORS 571]
MSHTNNPFSVTRRRFGALAAGTLVAGWSAGAHAQEKVVRIGYQKYGTLILLKNKGLLEAKLKPLGYAVRWAEFAAGPQLLEALNAGAIDFGNTGEAPPIFAQAAGAPLVYVGYEPAAPEGEAILVPKNSPLKTVADLKGKTVALNKGSNVHYLLVKALETANVSYTDIKTAFLTPADARAAFERGAVDAWAIWDPFQAAAETTIEARQLTNGTGIVSNYQFYFSTQSFVEKAPDVVDAVLAGVAEIGAWVKANPKAAAAEFSPLIGIPAPILEIALARQQYDVKPITPAVVAQQQQVADAFFKLGLIPKEIRISDAVRALKS